MIEVRTYFFDKDTDMVTVDINTEGLKAIRKILQEQATWFVDAGMIVKARDMLDDIVRIDETLEEIRSKKDDSTES